MTGIVFSAILVVEALPEGGGRNDGEGEAEEGEERREEGGQKRITEIRSFVNGSDRSTRAYPIQESHMIVS
jgi:hypothetical protein